MQRIPMTTARRLGLAALGDLTTASPILLTRWGQPVAVLSSAEWVDEDVRRMREAVLIMLDAAEDLVAERRPRHTLDEVCERLGIDAGEVRRRAAQLTEE